MKGEILFQQLKAKDIDRESCQKCLKEQMLLLQRTYWWGTTQSKGPLTS